MLCVFCVTIRTLPWMYLYAKFVYIILLFCIHKIINDFINEIYSPQLCNWNMFYINVYAYLNFQSIFFSFLSHVAVIIIIFDAKILSFHLTLTDWKIGEYWELCFGCSFRSIYNPVFWILFDNSHIEIAKLKHIDTREKKSKHIYPKHFHNYLI